MVNFKKGSIGKLGNHFIAMEFDCPCENCERTTVDMVLVRRLDAMRDDLGCPLFVTSGYRCDRHQYDLAQSGYDTAKGISTHQVGKAADVWTGKHTGHELEAAAVRSGFTSVGIGAKWVHVDVRIGERRWVYKR